MSCTSNITSGFIDLATYDELEKYFYGGSNATAYFVRETRKATWFTQVPVVLSRCTGSADFGQDFSVAISRAGDYLLGCWLRVTLPSVTLASPTNKSLRWTRNFMHNLISECSITFNDLHAQHFDNYHLDFWSAFTVPAGKSNGYKNMIGDFDDLIGGGQQSIPSFTLNLPLPFFFTRDSGLGLPTAALPYNEMRINFCLRNWTDLLIIDEASTKTSRVATSSDLTSTPSLTAVQVWANYAIVSNDERKRMACAPRNMLVEQTQSAPVSTWDPTRPGSIDLRFAHAIKVLFFAVQNTTLASQWSNYTTASPVPSNGSDNPVNLTPSLTSDPILHTSLTYENTARLQQMGSDYFSLIQPWYHAPVIPAETGYHMYSYSLDFISVDPKGSTNYGKLTNVSILPYPSELAVRCAAGGEVVTNVDTGAELPQKYKFVCTAVNNNVIRVSGGALGFPVL